MGQDFEVGRELLVYGSSAPPIASLKDEVILCQYCKKPSHYFSKQKGCNVGTGQFLRNNIINDITQHPWYAKPSALQAHHLICSEAMDEDDWASIAWAFGYDINHENNGVMLPHTMALACQLHVPLHRGNHDKGEAEGLTYPNKIKKDLKKIKKQIENGGFCDNPEALISELDDYSEFILEKLNAFRWTITADGRDYKEGGNGCAGVQSITGKPSKPCPSYRSHAITKHNSTGIIPRNVDALKIGY